MAATHRVAHMPRSTAQFPLAPNEEHDFAHRREFIYPSAVPQPARVPRYARVFRAGYYYLVDEHGNEHFDPVQEPRPSSAPSDHYHSIEAGFEPHGGMGPALVHLTPGPDPAPASRYAPSHGSAYGPVYSPPRGRVYSPTNTPSYRPFHGPTQGLTYTTPARTSAHALAQATSAQDQDEEDYYSPAHRQQHHAQGRREWGSQARHQAHR